jgi:DNA-binding CsgD family transcriptional regulator
MDLPQRVHGVRLLLGSLNDPYPTPQGALRPDSGPAASKYLPCETCRSTGRVRVRRGRYVLCLICDGRGERRRRHDDVEWDAYLRLPLEEAAQLPREPVVRSPRTGEEEGYGWERAQARQERQGSYRELRRQLDWLRQAHPRWHQLIVAVLVEHGERELGPHAALELELGVVAIALRMRSVRVPRWLVEPLERRQTVAELAARGLQAGEIARALGLSKKAVRRQLKRLDSRQAGAPARAV